MCNICTVLNVVAVTTYDNRSSTSRVSLRGVRKFPARGANFLGKISTLCTKIVRKGLLVTKNYGFPSVPMTSKKGGTCCQSVCVTPLSGSATFR